MEEQRTLCDLRPGESASVVALHLSGGMRRRLLDLGLIDKTRVLCLGRSPGGDPTAFLVRGAVIALRATDCRGILIDKIEQAEVAAWG